MLIIKNVSWKYKQFKDISALVNLLTSKMKGLNLNIKPKIEIDGSITFCDVSNNMTFASLKDNKILMRQGDPRVSKLGRDYLLTKRPTYKQYFGFFEVLHNTFDQLGLKADIELLVAKTGQKFIVRNGNNNLHTFPKVKSFPVE